MSVTMTDDRSLVAADASGAAVPAKRTRKVGWELTNPRRKERLAKFEAGNPSILPLIDSLIESVADTDDPNVFHLTALIGARTSAEKLEMAKQKVNQNITSDDLRLILQLIFNVVTAAAYEYEKQARAGAISSWASVVHAIREHTERQLGMLQQAKDDGTTYMPPNVSTLPALSTDSQPFVISTLEA